ncbi:MAG: ATP-binding cassette domain-containing protein [Chloroflexota bacterium]
MSEPLFQLDRVSQQYNGRIVLDLSTLTINQGEILAIVGPSGAGKSTLLRLLNFLETPHTGHIQFDGQRITPTLGIEQRRRVTMVFQNPTLLKRSVIKNLQYGLNLRGQKATESQLNAALKRVGLQDLGHQLAQKLSAGEAQRAALARALIIQPDVLLLDEPTANLDPQNVKLIEEIICEVNASQKTTVVIVTHNIFQAKRIANRTALLINGRLVEIAPTDQFFNAPERAETAVFISGDFIY